MTERIPNSSVAELHSSGELILQIEHEDLDEMFDSDVAAIAYTLQRYGEKLEEKLDASAEEVLVETGPFVGDYLDPTIESSDPLRFRHELDDEKHTDGRALAQDHNEGAGSQQ